MCNKNMSLVLIRREFFLGKTFRLIPIWSGFLEKGKYFTSKIMLYENKVVAYL